VTTAAKYAADMRRRAAGIDRAGHASVEAGARVMTARLRAAGAAHGPLHNKKGGPIKLGARYDVRRTGDGGEAYVKPKPAGAWTIVEHGAAPHLVGIAKRATRSGRSTSFLKGKGYAHPVRGPLVAHARGSRVWSRARDSAEPATMRAMAEEPLKVLRQVGGR
jgi:hypothetical protein